MTRPEVRSKFAARIWAERADWICAGIDELGTAVDAVWSAPAGRSPLGAGAPFDRARAFAVRWESPIVPGSGDVVFYGISGRV